MEKEKEKEMGITNGFLIWLPGFRRYSSVYLSIGSTEAEANEEGRGGALKALYRCKRLITGDVNMLIRYVKCRHRKCDPGHH